MDKDKKNIEDHYIEVPIDIMEEEEFLNKNLSQLTPSQLEKIKEIMEEDNFHNSTPSSNSHSSPPVISAVEKNIVFELEADYLKTEHIQNIILPKFILSETSTTKINEKGLLLLHFTNDNDPEVYPSVLNAIKNGLNHLRIKVFNSESDVVVWEFKNPRIQAVDFGILSVNKEQNNFCAEINYDSFSINKIEI